MVSKAVATMKPGRILIGAQEWLVGASVDGHAGPAKFYRVEGIPGRLQNGDVTGDGRNCHHANIGRAESHDEGNGIVGGSVGINQEGAWHAGRITALGSWLGEGHNPLPT